MNTLEKIYQTTRDLPEPLALEVLHFSEFLKAKQGLNKPNKTTIKAIQAGERGECETTSLEALTFK